MFLCIGAPAYITHNIAVAKGVLNGKLVKMDSLSFAEGVDVDAINEQINNAKPGEVVVLNVIP